MALSKSVLEKYAKLMINFAVNNTKGIRKGDTILIEGPEEAKPLLLEMYKEALRRKAHPLIKVNPKGFQKEFFKLATKEQAKKQFVNYYEGLVKELDHYLVVYPKEDPDDLKGADPELLMLRREALRPWSKFREEKELKGLFSWSLCAYPFESLAKKAGMSLREYEREIIKGCYLDKDDPIKEWKRIMREISTIKQRLNRLPIVKLLVTDDLGTDLEITLGDNRRWLSGSGHNIPSFEIFTSPDWRGTNGIVRFTEPLNLDGNIIEGISLEFKKGKVVKGFAKKNNKLLQSLLMIKNADKVGEFSLTDKRHSRISKFMALTLFDENTGGNQGNMHIALGKAYKDAFDGDLKSFDKKKAASLGFNDSGVHVDIITRAKRTVKAVLKDGREIVIYDKGEFKV